MHFDHLLNTMDFLIGEKNLSTWRFDSSRNSTTKEDQDYFILCNILLNQFKIIVPSNFENVKLRFYSIYYSNMKFLIAQGTILRKKI